MPTQPAGEPQRLGFVIAHRYRPGVFLDQSLRMRDWPRVYSDTAHCEAIMRDLDPLMKPDWCILPALCTILRPTGDSTPEEYLSRVLAEGK